MYVPFRAVASSWLEREITPAFNHPSHNVDVSSMLRHCRFFVAFHFLLYLVQKMKFSFFKRSVSNLFMTLRVYDTLI